MQDDRETLTLLHDAAASMDLPETRKDAEADVDLQWLGRNMALRNRAHPPFQDAAKALKALGVRFTLN